MTNTLIENLEKLFILFGLAGVQVNGVWISEDLLNCPTPSKSMF